jgi:hypothetical protein
MGLELEFKDRGPGIADLQRVLAGGYSTAKSLACAAGKPNIASACCRSAAT